jgi:hypothetical protein
VAINVSVTIEGSALLNLLKIQQSIARGTKLDEDIRKKLEEIAIDERKKQLASQGLDQNGRPIGEERSPVVSNSSRKGTFFGSSSQSGIIHDEPAANRFPKPEQLAHVWILGEEYAPGPTGIIETNRPGTDTILLNDVLWKASKTGTYGLTQTKQNVLIGSGKGTSWVTFTDKGRDNLPPLPEDTWNPVDCFADIPTTPSESGNSYRYHEGQRLSMQPLTGGRVDIQFAIPCGNKAFVLVYGFTDVWDTVQTNAHYYVRGVYAANTGAFLGYEQRDPNTGEILSELSSVPSDWVRGFPVPNCNAPPPPYLYNNGVWSFEGFRGKTRKIKAYICNDDSIREISIPSTLQAIIDVAYPDAVDDTTSIIYRENFFSYAKYSIPSGFPIYGDQGLLSANYRGSVFTPKVFERLNEINQFVNPSTIKQFPQSLPWIMYDTSEGSYAAYQDSNPSPFETPTYWSQLYRDGLPFYHAYWIEKNQEPNYEIYDPNYAADWEGVSRPRRIPRATLNLDPERPAREGATDRTSLVGSYWGEDFVTVWDWNDPGYCRQQALALGFSAADLTP